MFLYTALFTKVATEGYIGPRRFPILQVGIYPSKLLSLNITVQIESRPVASLLFIHEDAGLTLGCFPLLRNR